MRTSGGIPIFLTNRVEFQKTPKPSGPRDLNALSNSSQDYWTFGVRGQIGAAGGEVKPAHRR